MGNNIILGYYLRLTIKPNLAHRGDPIFVTLINKIVIKKSQALSIILSNRKLYLVYNRSKRTYSIEFTNEIKT